MTVRELVEHLQTLPQDYLVAYRNCSDSSKMEADQIEVYPSSEKKVVQHHNMPDQVRDYNSWEYAGHNKPQPVFLDVVMFPGN